ncbi:MAG: L-histidine Nalpha-methyltransferase [Acidobacteriota bacterium]|jgi:dimethylhistidine N-methyltransferase|nr:L-histidine Nalpha-methyltransferase [Acidobacteriota bacterium]
MSQASSEHAPAERLTINNLIRSEARATLADDVREGLSPSSKKLFPKYFYDALGSQLFEAICLLPEYYLTRAENEILTRYADQIVSEVASEKVSLLEMGSGSALKTRLIIEALLKRQSELLFIPVDISLSALETSSRVLLQSYPALRINAYASDYYDGLKALSTEQQRGHTLALFLGSNIGNFDLTEAQTFLRAMRSVLKAGDALLLGADLRKRPEILEAAYDDSLGITAAFNLNLLARINRELDADFDLRAFRHQAVYNEEQGRVELYIQSLRAQTVSIRKLEMEIHFTEGERIHTENSYKYDLAGLSALASATGYTRSRTWLDEREQFSSNLFMAVE